MMFSLADIDGQIWLFNHAADDLEKKADELTHPVMQSALRGAANGLRDAAGSLARMIEREIEREAREALR